MKFLALHENIFSTVNRKYSFTNATSNMIHRYSLLVPTLLNVVEMLENFQNELKTNYKLLDSFVLQKINWYLY